MFFLALMTGCAGQTRYYFYEGPPRPATDVSVVVMNSTLKWTSFDGTPIRRPYLTHTFDALPGAHTLDFTYSLMTKESHSTTRISKGALTTLQFNVQANHVYYIYPSFPSPAIWQPQIIDFGKVEDLPNALPVVWDAIPVPDDHKESVFLSIREKAEQHFQNGSHHSFQVSARQHWE